MAKQAKGQKYGRNRDRNPSSRLQKARTERNKARKIKAAGTAYMAPGGKPHPVPSTGREKPRSGIPGLVPDQSGIPLHLLIVAGVLCDIAPQASRILSDRPSLPHLVSRETLNPISGKRTPLRIAGE